MPKPFFHQGTRTHVSAILGAAAPEEVICRYRAAESDGADSVALELRYLRPEFRNLETLRRSIHATSLPTMAIMYRNDCFKELVEDAPRQKLLLTAAEAGAAVIDVMGDLYSPAPDENTHDPAVIARQKELIGEIHARGALALMSSHPKRFMRADEVLAQLEDFQDRGADIVKIVTKADTPEEYLETLRGTVAAYAHLKVPFVHISNGSFGRLHRMHGLSLGVAVTFAVHEYYADTPFTQPTIRDFRQVMEHTRWEIGSHAAKQTGSK